MYTCYPTFSLSLVLLIYNIYIYHFVTIALFKEEEKIGEELIK